MEYSNMTYLGFDRMEQQSQPDNWFDKEDAGIDQTKGNEITTSYDSDYLDIDSTTEEVSEQKLSELGQKQLKNEVLDTQTPGEGNTTKEKKSPTQSIYIKDGFVYLTKGQDVQKLPVDQYTQQTLGIEMPNSIIAKKAQLAYEVATLWSNIATNQFPQIKNNDSTDFKVVTIRQSLTAINQAIADLQAKSIPVASNENFDIFTNTIKEILHKAEVQVGVVGIKDTETMFDKIYHDSKDTPEQFETTRVNILNLFRKSAFVDHLWLNEHRGGNSTLIQATFGAELIQTSGFYNIKTLFDNQSILDSIKAGNFDTNNDSKIQALFKDIGGDYEWGKAKEMFKKIRINGPKQGMDNDQITLNFINSLQLYLIGKQLEWNPKLREDPKGKAFYDIMTKDKWLDQALTMGKELVIQGVCLFVSGGIANLAVRGVQGLAWGARAAKAGMNVGQYLNTAGRAVKTTNFLGSIALEGTLFHGLHTVTDSGVRAMLGEEYHMRDELKDGKGYAKSIAFMGVLKAIHGTIGKLTTTVGKNGNIAYKEWYQSMANPKNPIGKLFFKEAAEKGITTNMFGNVVKFTSEGIILTATGVTVDVGFGDRTRNEWTRDEVVQGILLSVILAKSHAMTGKLMVKKSQDGTISVEEIIQRVEKQSGIKFSDEQKSKIEQFSKVRKVQGKDLEQKLKNQLVGSRNNELLPEQNNQIISQILLESDKSPYESKGVVDKELLHKDVDMIQKTIKEIHDGRKNATPKEKKNIYRDGTGAAGDLYNLTAKEITRTQTIMTTLELPSGKKLTGNEVTRLMDEGVLGSIKSEIDQIQQKFNSIQSPGLFTISEKITNLGSLLGSIKDIKEDIRRGNKKYDTEDQNIINNGDISTIKGNIENILKKEIETYYDSIINGTDVTISNIDTTSKEVKPSEKSVNDGLDDIDGILKEANTIGRILTDNKISDQILSKKEAQITRKVAGYKDTLNEQLNKIKEGINKEKSAKRYLTDIVMLANKNPEVPGFSEYTKLVELYADYQKNVINSSHIYHNRAFSQVLTDFLTTQGRNNEKKIIQLSIYGKGLGMSHPEISMAMINKAEMQGNTKSSGSIADFYTTDMAEINNSLKTILNTQHGGGKLGTLKKRTIKDFMDATSYGPYQEIADLFIQSRNEGVKAYGKLLEAEIKTTKLLGSSVNIERIESYIELKFGEMKKTYENKSPQDLQKIFGDLIALKSPLVYPLRIMFGLLKNSAEKYGNERLFTLLYAAWGFVDHGMRDGEDNVGGAKQLLRDGVGEGILGAGKNWLFSNVLTGNIYMKLILLTINGIIDDKIVSNRFGTDTIQSSSYIIDYITGSTLHPNNKSKIDGSN
ncbi:MAG TPA: hypothetical protein PLW93_01180, partial [Candidatus Absconditabacterales bacterium]|nr:hypothetical protein [Candidatus Absconditabacterales bacterium]